MPSRIDPDDRRDGLLAVGATFAGVTPSGFEKYEAAANAVAEQALGDFYAGLEIALASILVSPDFLFRIEEAEPDPGDPSTMRLTSVAMASRLSYLLWNTTPDDDLIAAGENGDLVDDDRLAEQVERLLSSPKLVTGAKLRDQVSILSDFDVKLDGRPNFPHTAGLMGTLTGSLPVADYTVPAPTLDTIIAAEIGGLTRFRSLEMSCTGNPNQSYSFESQGVANAPEISPMAMYTRVFGPEFADPNAGPFTPDPRQMIRQSVLSVVKDDGDRLLQRVGTHDKQRLEQYFTSVRQLEQQLDILLEGPPDLESCSKAPAPGRETLGTEVGESMSTNRLMADLLSFALACDQTRVFSMMFSDRISGLRRSGSSSQHHQLTHDEPLDPAIGYQPEATEFVFASMEAWADFVERLAAIPEGDGTLLDNCLVLGHSDVSLAKVHGITGVPMMVAGSAGGALKPGVHVRGATSPTTRVGLTIQQAMGLNTESWGTRSMEATQPVSEIVA